MAATNQTDGGLRGRDDLLSLVKDGELARSGAKDRPFRKQNSCQSWVQARRRDGPFLD